MKAYIILFCLLLTAGLDASILLDINHYNPRLYGSSEALLVEDNDINNLEIFPASLAGIEHNEISTGYLAYLDFIHLYNFCFARRVGPADVIGISVNYADLKQFNNYDTDGTVLGSLQDNDFALNLAYGHLWTRTIQIGAGVRYVNMNINEYSGNWLGLSLSALFKFKLPAVNILKKETISAGLGVQNIGMINTRFDEQISSYPVILNTGFIYDLMRINRLMISLGSTLFYYTRYEQISLSAGIELNWLDLIFLRTGYYITGREYDKLNLGLGFKRMLIKEKIELKFDFGTGIISDFHNRYLQVSIGF